MIVDMRIDVEPVLPLKVTHPEVELAPKIPDHLDGILGVRDPYGKIVHTGTNRASLEQLIEEMKGNNTHEDKPPYAVVNLPPGEEYQTPYGPQQVKSSEQ